MKLNDLLLGEGIDPHKVLVLRHRPHEPKLNKIFPWLAEEKPEVFNAYQQTHGERLENPMRKLVGSGYIASFIGHEPRKALFIGLYSITASKPLTYEEYWKVPDYIELKNFGMTGFTKEDPRTSILWFDLSRTDFYSHWKGKMIVDWPPPERSWWRRAHRNEIPVFAILEENSLASSMPEWNEIVLTWKELEILPKKWRTALTHWRGIYYIYDISDGKGYVGSAYGDSNLYGRWKNYAASGDGGNKLLKKRDPRNFKFSILQRVSPDMENSDVIKLENTWKERLHSRTPHGLNNN